MDAAVTGISSLLGANKQKKAVDRARREQQASADAAQARLAPYQETGSQANQMIQEGLSTGTLGGSFTPGDLADDPRYQFQLEQGEQALGRQQSAGGNIYSGRAVKEGQRFSQGLAGQSYQDAYNNWMRTQENKQNFLSGQQSQGSGVATNQGNIDLGQGNYAAQATMARREAQDRGTAGAVGAFQDKYKQAQDLAGGFSKSMLPSSFVSY
jgi:hypothetical protein